jgi:hypothetical protein
MLHRSKSRDSFRQTDIHFTKSGGFFTLTEKYAQTFGLLLKLSSCNKSELEISVLTQINLGENNGN